MDSLIEKLKKLDDFISYGGATPTSIEAAERELDLVFANEYKEYLTAFGAVCGSGFELTGIVNNKRLNVVYVTKEMREKASVPNNLYVIEEMHIDGLVIWQDASGCIFQTTPGSTPVKIADSFAEYLTT